MRRRVWAALAAIGAGAALASASSGCLVSLLLTPPRAFDPAGVPVAPDYTQEAAWGALPERVDAGDAVPDGVVARDQAAAPADAFFVHSTSYVGNHWNGPIDDPSLAEATDRVGIGVQATPFNGCCAVYAPRYRQANGTAFTEPSADGDRALDVAYGDVSRAFDAFLERRGTERPFVLAGHSQGTILAERLLRERIAGTPLQERLVVAVLPGGEVTVEELRAAGVPACGSPEGTGCVVAWNARSPGHVDGRFTIARRQTGELLCTNPLSWRADGERVPAARNLGAAFLDAPDRRPMPGFADARCLGGVLEVTELGKAPRDLPSRILDRVVGVGNYHPIEVQLYFLDLRANAEQRVAAWLLGAR